jgi:hypothetical protein
MIQDIIPQYSLYYISRKIRHAYLGLISPMDFEYTYNQKTKDIIIITTV